MEQKGESLRWLWHKLVIGASRGFAFQVKSLFAQYRQILLQHYISGLCVSPSEIFSSVSTRNILQLEKKKILNIWDVLLNLTIFFFFFWILLCFFYILQVCNIAV